MKIQPGKNRVGKATGDSLRDFSVGRIPIEWAWLDGQLGLGGVATADLLKLANVDLGNSLQSSLGRLFDMSAKQVPVLFKRNQGKSADGDPRTDKQAG